MQPSTSPPDEPAQARLTGWGRTSPSTAQVVEVDAASAASLLDDPPARGVIARGLGRSYGDAAQNGGGLVARLRGDVGEARLDHEAGTVTVGAGTSIDDLLRLIVPLGWFVPVTAGTRFITVGGAIASDIHGKNHHVDGSFGNHVTRLGLLLADGTPIELTAQSDPALFWATVGGMGLTGIIVDATIRLIPIESSRISVDTDRARDLDEVMALMIEGDHRYRYSVAWIDPLAKGKHLGRSVLTRGDHAPVAALAGHSARQPLSFDPKVLATTPPMPPSGLINHATVRAFNEMWFRKAPRRRRDELQSISFFFHPLDLVGEWNKVYGRRGLVQYQFVMPFGQEAALRRIVERMASAGAASFLSVLKRFGASNPAPLSFPTPGWTLAVDLPAGAHGVGDLFHEIDRLVLDAGGRHYLTKDAHTTPATVRRGYPRLEEWQAVRDKADPGRVWASDLARRLELLG